MKGMFANSQFNETFPNGMYQELKTRTICLNIPNSTEISLGHGYVTNVKNVYTPIQWRYF